jgi:hypothetical protein
MIMPPTAGLIVSLTHNCRSLHQPFRDAQQ